MALLRCCTSFIHHVLQLHGGIIGPVQGESDCGGRTGIHRWCGGSGESAFPRPRKSTRPYAEGESFAALRERNRDALVCAQRWTICWTNSEGKAGGAKGGVRVHCGWRSRSGRNRECAGKVRANPTYFIGVHGLRSICAGEIPQEALSGATLTLQSIESMRHNFHTLLFPK